MEGINPVAAIRRAECQAEEQHGVLANWQLDDFSIPRWKKKHLVDEGRWIPELPGVVRVAGAPRSWEQDVMALCLWGGARAVASHRTAARLLGLDGDWGTAVEVTVPYATNERLDGFVVHRTRRLDDRDRTLRDGIPVTAAERTIVDLAAVLERDDLEVALESAVRRSLTDPAHLWRRVEALAGRRGLGSVVELLRARQTKPSHSEWEVRMLQLIRNGGLPEPVKQHRVWDGETWRYLDLAYPELKVAFEYDSYTFHSGRRDWERTHTRYAGLTARGWRILPVAWNDLVLSAARTLSRMRALYELARP